MAAFVSKAESLPDGPRRRSHLFVLLAALLLFGVLAAEEFLSVRHLSMTVDEGAHTYAGYEHWKARDFGVNPEHPPLVKLVATIPLLSLHLQQPHPPPINFMVEQYAGGDQLYNQNDGDLILTRTRMGASVFTFLLALLLFAAGYEIFGPAVGLIALALFTFEPTVLAHGALVTTDMGVACFLFASFYTYYRYLSRPTVFRLLICGLMFGFALAAKVSGVLAIPILVVLALADLFLTDLDRAKRGRTLLLSLLAISITGYVTLWSFYTFRYAARPGGLTLRPTLEQMAHGMPHPWQANLVLQLATWHVLPEAYLYAWAKLISNIAGQPAFLFGHIYRNGIWFYFPAALLVKTTLTLLILFAVSAFITPRFGRKSRLPLIGLALTCFLILLSGITSHLDIGVRHELALYPFAIMLAAAGAWALARTSRVGAIAVGVLLLFQCVSSLRSYPDYLPYANEAFGGSSKTYLALTDSNVDWAQQLKEVSNFRSSHPGEECWFAYSMMGISQEKVPCKLLPTGLALIAGVPASPVPPHIRGTVLIGALDASGALWGPGDLNPYHQFQEGHPAEMVGNSVLVYRGDFDVPLIAAMTHMSQVPVLLRIGKLDAALGEATTAISLDPQSPMLETGLGGALLQMGRKDEAEAAFARARQKACYDRTEGALDAVEARIDRIEHPPF